MRFVEEKKKKKYYIGIDEVGRGCLAGPVVVGGVMICEDFDFSEMKEDLRDSKKMTRLQREKWFEYLKDNNEAICEVCKIKAEEIDKINISASANKAAFKVFQRLIKKADGEVRVVLDGGLFLKDKENQKGVVSGGVEVMTVKKADNKFKEVMMASVYAKVSRDSHMKRMGRFYPSYGFADHKGYGTKAHIDSIRRFGPIPGFHRKSFLKKII